MCAQPAVDPSTASPSARPTRRGLQAMGLSEQEEMVFRALLRRPGAGAVELMRLTSCGPAMLESVLASLQTRGLIRRRSDASAGWLSVEPEVAIELLLMEKQAELNEARNLVPELRRELVQSSAVGTEQAVETIAPDPDAKMEAYVGLWQQARRGILNIMRPPFGVAGAPLEKGHEAASSHGVRIRHLLAPEVLKWPGILANCAQLIEAGEAVRVSEGLPTRLMLVDDEVALVPLHADDASGPLVRVRDSALLKVLVDYGERLWDQAVPLLPTAGEAQPAAPDDESSLRELAMLLASGSKDKTVADLLGISERTLQRRIGLLAERFRARSRFQCGWLAAREFDR